MWNSPGCCCRSRWRGREITGSGLRLAGRLVGTNAAPIPDVAALSGKVPETEQSNSNVVFGDQLIFKLYRRLGEGINPELEVGEHLTAKAHFPNSPPLTAAIEVQGIRGNVAPQTLAVVLTFVPNQGDAWHVFVDHGQRYFEALGALTPEQVSTLCMPGDKSCAVDSADVPQPVQNIVGGAAGAGPPAGSAYRGNACGAGRRSFGSRFRARALQRQLSAKFVPVHGGIRRGRR